MVDHDDLVTRAGGGDDVAIDALLERHLPGLRAFVRLRMGAGIRARESQADVVQSVCREVLVGMERFEYQGEAAFRSWLYTMALRKLVERDRYYHRDKRDVGREEDADVDLLSCYGSMFTPSRHAAAREEVARFEAAFDALPEHYREVILLTRILGLSQREVGERVGRTEVAVQGLLTRALVRLSDLLRSGGA